MGLKLTEKTPEWRQLSPFWYLYCKLWTNCYSSLLLSYLWLSIILIIISIVNMLFYIYENCKWSMKLLYLWRQMYRYIYVYSNHFSSMLVLFFVLAFMSHLTYSCNITKRFRSIFSHHPCQVLNISEVRKTDIRNFWQNVSYLRHFKRNSRNE